MGCLMDGRKDRITIDERKTNSLPGKPYHEADFQVSKPYSRRQGDASLYLGLRYARSTGTADGGSA